MNRYIYDLSQEGGSANLNISDSTGTISHLVAYGGQFLTGLGSQAPSLRATRHTETGDERSKRATVVLAGAPSPVTRRVTTSIGGTNGYFSTVVTA
jgi:hypothetical protein